MADSRNRETAGEDTRDFRIGKVLNELLDRRACGETVSESDLIAQHPEFADDLRRHLRFLRNLEPPGDQVGRLVATGVLKKPADSTCLARLGPYRITGTLGRGGMSIVLRAYEEKLDRTVALKILRPELTHDDNALRRFAREAKAAAGLQHPNIVTVHAVGNEGGTHYLSMEHIDGPTLATLIRRCGPLPAQMVRHLLRQILSGLGAAHGANLVHRDIKPSNILLTGLLCESAVESNSCAREESPFLAKIADFGLALVASSYSRITLPDSVLGTPEYMSPEQARGDENIDHRADLYSVGVVLYEMLTGRTPFRADKGSAVIHQILHDDPPDPMGLNGNIDPTLASLALRLMAKRPEDRFESAEEAIAVLDAGQRVVLLDRKRQKRLRVVVVLLALIAVLTASALTYRLFPKEPITHVAVDYDNDNLKTAILARRGNSTELVVFHDFGNAAECVSDAALVDKEGDGEPDAVVAAISPNIGPHCILAYDLDAHEIWRSRLTPPQPLAWPDFDGSPSEWHAGTVQAADVDGIPGDEIVATGRDRTQYPSCLTVIDPRSGSLGSTFFHTGEIYDVIVVEDYFGDGRPAIVAWGVNNKLDGYREPVEGITFPAHHEQVPVVMILDPANMSGLGPPHPVHPDLVSLGTARPWDYAFLDQPSEVLEERGPAWEDNSRTAVIATVTRHLRGTSERDDAFLEIGIRSIGRGSTIRGAISVDRDLNFLQVKPSRYERHLPDEDDWKAVWRPVIQRGRNIHGGRPSTRFRGLPPIRDVKVDHADENLKRFVLARYGDSTDWREFHDFGEKADLVVDPKVIDFDADGSVDQVVAGVVPAISGDCLFAFDPNGGDMWRARLTPEPNLEWPDFDGHRAEWHCTALAAGDVDGIPGPEVIACARDRSQYPACLTVINPRAGERLSTFYHMGELRGILILEDYFQHNRPAILVWGVNNKLDGFREPYQGGPSPLTEYELVYVVMILDPGEMDGLGPPHPAHPNLAPLGRAMPWAYAYLDVAAETRENRGVGWEDPSRTADVWAVKRRADTEPGFDSPFLEVHVRSLDQQQFGRAGIRLDRDLGFHSVHICRGERHRLEEDDWRVVWKPVIRKGKYIE